MAADVAQIAVSRDDRVGVEEYMSVMAGSGLDQRRPYDDADRLGVILAHSAPIITARTEEGTLVGVARSISDGGFATYLCDIAVVDAYQGRGLARALVEATRDACERTIMIVSAAPEVDAFYDHLGLRRHHTTWYDLPPDLDGFPTPPVAT